MKRIITIAALACLLAAPACAQNSVKKTKTELSMERQGMVDIHTKDTVLYVLRLFHDDHLPNL